MSIHSDDIPRAVRVRMPAEDGEWTIGRAPDCDIVLDDPAVAEVHAQLQMRAGRLSIADVGAFSGVYVNGVRTSGRDLHTGDSLYIAPIYMTVDDGELVFAGRSTSGVQVDALDVWRDTGSRVLVDDVSVSFLPGEFVALLGPSGCGKSSLVATLAGVTPPSFGVLLYNGEDLYANITRFRPMIGYVAQFPAMHAQLTVAQVLNFEARLRLAGMTGRERADRIAEVLSIVGLDHRGSTAVRVLSGGEQKRVAIAVELLCDPRILWLDEPTSGLDPHLHRHMMDLFRELADQGITVVAVTHSADGLESCDRLVFMAPGGRIAYEGTPDHAPRAFSARDLVECYEVAQLAPESMCDQHDAIRGPDVPVPRSRRDAPRDSEPGVGGFSQLMTKTHRAVRVLTADRRASIILLLQAPILAAMAALVVADGAFTDIKVPARELLVAGFAMSIIMIWLGLINSVREFSKERRVWARERMAGASLWAYIGSKVIVQWSIVTAQALVLLVIVSLFRTGIAASNSGVTTGHIELLVTLALTGMAASSIGLVVSASVSNEDRGSSLVPYLIIPQYLLSGIAIAIPASTMWVSSLTIPYWSVAALASTLDACSRPFVGGPTCSDALRLPIGNEPAALLSFWAVLGGICVVSIAIVAALLMLRDRARNVR